MDKFTREHYGPMFMKHVKKTTGCWHWTGAADLRNTAFTPVRYGVYRMRKPTRKTYYAHRFSYELHVGEIAEGLQIDHLCKNTLCVNPKHLEPVTPKVNVLRGNTVAAKHAKKTHCPKGHPYAGDNIILRHRDGRAMRNCRICTRARNSAYWKEYARAKNGERSG